MGDAKTVAQLLAELELPHLAPLLEDAGLFGTVESLVTPGREFLEMMLLELEVSQIDAASIADAAFRPRPPPPPSQIEAAAAASSAVSIPPAAGAGGEAAANGDFYFSPAVRQPKYLPNLLENASLAAAEILEDGETPTAGKKKRKSVTFAAMTPTAAAAAAAEEEEEEQEEDEAIGDMMIDFLGELDDGPEDEADSGGGGGGARHKVANMTRSECVEWLERLPPSLGVRVPDEDEGLCGAALLAAAESTRELRETFGLATIEARVAFSTALEALDGREGTGGERADAGGTATSSSTAMSTGVGVKAARPSCSSGGLYNEKFIETTRGLYDMHMGVENMAPLLYTLLRFLKPARVLEVTPSFTLTILQSNPDPNPNPKPNPEAN